MIYALISFLNLNFLLFLSILISHDIILRMSKFDIQLSLYTTMAPTEEIYPLPDEPEDDDEDDMEDEMKCDSRKVEKTKWSLDEVILLQLHL